MADNHRGTAQVVACRDDAVFRQNQHRTGTLDFPVDQIDAVYKSFTHIYQQGHNLCLVDIVGRQLAEVHLLFKKFGGDFAEIIDFSHCHNRIAAEMGVYDNRLWVCVANYSKSLIPGK